MLRVTPIYGSRWSDAGQAEEPECTLVEFSGCRVLWNVGWFGHNNSSDSSSGDSNSNGHNDVGLPEENDTSLCFPADKLPDHDCLILTDSTLQACGGLPMYFAAMKQKLAAASSSSSQGDDDHATSLHLPPVYATYPTVKMGQMTLYDQHAAICLDGGKPPYSLKDLDHAIAAVQCIKFSQSITVGNILTVTAHRAGHVVGGAFYNLKRLQDETTVVLTTSTYHIARELHLDSSTLLKHAMTPDVLVTRPGGGPALRRAKALATHHRQQQQQQNQRATALPPVLVTQAENNLTEAIFAVLRRDGNVLLPVDASGRVLELILLLHRTWEKQRLQGTYNLCWLGPMVHNTREFACCQLEWMASSLGQEFDSGKPHPFSLKQVKLCTSMNEFREFMAVNPNTPTCVVASGLSLEAGPARDVLVEWADNPDHAIIFTDSSQCYLRRHIVHAARQRRQQQQNQEQQEHQLIDESQRSETHAMQESEALLASAAAVTTTTTLTSEATTAAPAAPATGDGSDTAESEAGGLLAGAVALDESQVSEWTTAGQLLCAWVSAKAEDREMDDSIAVDVYVPHRVPLVGAELKSFLEKEEAARLQEQAEEEKRAMLREVELAKGELRLGEDDATTSTDFSRKTTSSTVLLARPKKKSRFNQALFLKFSKPLHLTFEIREEPVGIAQPIAISKYGIGESVGRSGEVLEDDYGIAVVPEMFVDIVSGIDSSKFTGAGGRIGDEIARRGLGYAFDGGKQLSSKASSGARQAPEDEGEEEFDEQALEATDLSEGSGVIRGRNGRPPIKVVSLPRKLEVLAEVSFLPMEGKVDARAARQSVRALQPRQVVVLGGPAQGDTAPTLVDEVSLLAEAAQTFATGGKAVLTPSDAETAELHVGHAAYAVRLVDTPYRNADEMDTSEGQDTPIEMYEAKLGPCTVSLIDSVATGQRVAVDGSIVLAPRPISMTADDSPSVYLSDGEILLTDLRADLAAQGFKVVYGARQLVVNGNILVRKEQETGRLHVEGPLCEDFFSVRNIVCGHFVTL